MKQLKALKPFKFSSYEVLYPTTVTSQKEIDELMVKNSDDGYEGLMLRALNGPFKMGR